MINIPFRLVSATKTKAQIKSLTLDADSTVYDIKKQIYSKSNQQLPISQQTLYCRGQLFSDDDTKTIQMLNITRYDFIVCAILQLEEQVNYQENVGEVMDDLKRKEEYQQLVTCTRESPALLQLVIGQFHPQVVERMVQFPNEIVQCLVRDLKQEQKPAALPVQYVDEETKDSDSTPAPSLCPPEFIYRLEAMGFLAPQILEAYFVCDQNEALAVNYLLQNL